MLLFFFNYYLMIICTALLFFHGSDMACSWSTLSIFWWLLLGSSFQMLDYKWFSVCSWLWISCTSCPFMNANEVMFMGLWRPSFLNWFFLPGLVLLASLRIVGYFSCELIIGYVFVLGCVVDPSVAPDLGEQPRSIAPQYKQSFPLRSRMNCSPSETFFGVITAPVIFTVYFAGVLSLLKWLIKPNVLYDQSAYSWVFWDSFYRCGLKPSYLNYEFFWFSLMLMGLWRPSFLTWFFLLSRMFFGPL